MILKNTKSGPGASVNSRMPSGGSLHTLFPTHSWGEHQTCADTFIVIYAYICNSKDN